MAMTTAPAEPATELQRILLDRAKVALGRDSVLKDKEGIINEIVDAFGRLLSECDILTKTDRISDGYTYPLVEAYAFCIIRPETGMSEAETRRCRGTLEWAFEPSLPHGPMGYGLRLHDTERAESIREEIRRHLDTEACPSHVANRIARSGIL